MVKKVAVILFNLGGPDGPEAVKPFLFNLFYDSAIIKLPNPFRFLIAKLISSRREQTAKDIYEKIGGRSPILELTRKQAEALEKELGDGYKTFVSMRYSRPFAKDVAEEVKKYNPDETILLPLYPQYSSTTTASSVRDWKKTGRSGKVICCYPTEENFIEAHTELIKPEYEEAKKYGVPRILFSAHGLPEKIINEGDPYKEQVEMTVGKIVKKLDIKDLDYVTCYQSRVGPLKWIEPYTDREILRAAEDKKPIVIVPVAFVSEHSETLVELDIEYKKLAEEKGMRNYFRIPALGVNEKFIEALKKLVVAAETNSAKVCSGEGKRTCNKDKKLCPCVS